MTFPECGICGRLGPGRHYCMKCVDASIPDRALLVPPYICTLLGPTAHYKSFDAASVELGKLGWLVFTVGSHRLDDRGLGTTDGQRRVYWRTHRQKMNLSTMAFIVDLPDPQSPASRKRVGSDTAEEIEYADEMGLKIVRMSSVWPAGLPVAPRHVPDSREGVHP